MKIKLKVKHLGQFLDGDSLEASVSATVENRAGKFKGAVFETKLINEELSTQSRGGLWWQGCEGEGNTYNWLATGQV